MRIGLPLQCRGGLPCCFPQNADLVAELIAKADARQSECNEAKMALAAAEHRVKVRALAYSSTVRLPGQPGHNLVPLTSTVHLSSDTGGAVRAAMLADDAG